MPTSYTNRTKPSTSYTNRTKPTITTVTGLIGVPIGMLMALTYAGTSTVVASPVYTNRTKPTTSYTNRTKP